MPWFAAKDKKTHGIDPRNPSVADGIANAYARVLRESEKPPRFRPISELPYSKEQIAVALMTDSLFMRDPEFTRAAGVCYVQLAGFLSDEDAALAARVDRRAGEPGSETGNRTPDAEGVWLRGRHAEIVAAFNDELRRLNQEWQAFLERNGLAEPEDNVPPSLRAARTAKKAELSGGRLEQQVLQTMAAAGQGDAAAQCRLGWLCLVGEGVPQDCAEAAAWFRKAAGRMVRI